MSIDLGRRVAKLNYGDPFTAYTGITITSPDSEDKFTSGNDSGRILEVEIPWASQKMADNLLAQFRGVQHQPFTATGAILDPAAEIGDAVTVDGVSGIMYRRDQRFGSLYRADISAPGDEEINHEIPYYPPIQRAVTRFGNVARGAASLAAQSMKRQDGIEEDFKELTATVTDVQAGMKAYVKNDTFNDYKEAVAQLFAEVNEEDENIRSELTLHASSIDGLQEASADLMTRVSGAETALEMQSQTIDDLYAANVSLAARADNAEAELSLHAETINGVSASIATLSADVVKLQGRVNLTDVAYVSEGNGLGVNGSVVANGNLLVSGYIGTTANGPIVLAGKNFTPKEITSTDGVKTVLGAA